jgi:hypothetical protein
MISSVVNSIYGNRKHVKAKITRKAMDLRAGVEYKMLSCVWSSQKYVSHQFSTQNIQYYDTKYTVYAVEISCLHLQQRHIKTDPLKCGKYGHQILSTTHEHKQFVIRVLMTIVGMLTITTNSTVKNSHMNGCHHTVGDTIYCRCELSVHEYAYVQQASK